LFILDHNFWSRNSRSPSNAQRFGLEPSFQ